MGQRFEEASASEMTDPMPHTDEPGPHRWDGPLPPRERSRRPTLALAVGAGVLVVGASGGAAALYQNGQATTTVHGLRLSGEELSAVSQQDLPARVHAITERFLDRKLRLLIGTAGDGVHASLRELGMGVDEAKIITEARRIGHSGSPMADLAVRWRAHRGGMAVPLPVTLGRGKALEYLTELKDQVDRSPSDAHLDLEHHTIALERSGYLLRAYDSLVALEYAARRLSSSGSLTSSDVELSVAEAQPRVRAADLRDVDVSTVLATWETRYSSAAIDNDRTYNLKVGADKLNGHILKPREVFSFNETVGDRTEKQGYRVAPVIQGGELIDGLAGGMCQIASTLHAAAFFAGLDIVRSTPHSRPSAYIPMGLDSTVVWPSVDLKLKNPYDFPVVLHYAVNQGSVKVELLGKARPYRAAYEREILSETAFGVEVRHDPTLAAGQKVIAQEGYPGYRIKRRRYLFTGKWQLDAKHDNQPKPEVPIAKKEWDIGYPATTQIIRVGTGSPKLPKKDPPPSHHIPAIPPSDKPFFYLVK